MCNDFCILLADSWASVSGCGSKKKFMFSSLSLTYHVHLTMVRRDATVTAASVAI
jgi:hypothetical protein